MRGARVMHGTRLCDGPRRGHVLDPGDDRVARRSGSGRCHGRRPPGGRTYESRSGGGGLVDDRTALDARKALRGRRAWVFSSSPAYAGLRLTLAAAGPPALRRGTGAARRGDGDQRRRPDHRAQPDRRTAGRRAPSASRCRSRTVATGALVGPARPVWPRGPGSRRAAGAGDRARGAQRAGATRPAAGRPLHRRPATTRRRADVARAPGFNDINTTIHPSGEGTHAGSTDKDREGRRGRGAGGDDVLGLAPATSGAADPSVHLRGQRGAHDDRGPAGDRAASTTGRGAPCATGAALPPLGAATRRSAGRC